MKKNLIVTGGIFHPFKETSNSLSKILSEMEYVSEITTDIEEGFSQLHSFDLLTLNFLRNSSSLVLLHYWLPRSSDLHQHDLSL